MNVKELAEQCYKEYTSYFDGRGNITTTTFDKEMFAELVCAAEREACEKVCDDHWNKSIYCGDKAGALQCVGIRTAIRARSKK